MSGGPGRNRSTERRDVGVLPSDNSEIDVDGAPLLLPRGRGRVTRKLLRREQRGEGIPRQLLLDRVCLVRRNSAPVVDGSRGTGGDARHAGVTNVRLDHVVAIIVGNRPDRASRLAGIAADADLGIDEVLLHGGLRHRLFPFS